MRGEEHFGQFVPRKIITWPKEAPARYYLQKVHGNFFRTSCENVSAGVLKSISACPYNQLG